MLKLQQILLLLFVCCVSILKSSEMILPTLPLPKDYPLSLNPTRQIKKTQKEQFFKKQINKKFPLSPRSHPLLIRVLTFSHAVFTRATSLRASPASSLSLWASWLPFSSNHCCECCRDWSSSSSWTKKRSLGEIDAEENNRGYLLDSSIIYLIFQEIKF